MSRSGTRHGVGGVGGANNIRTVELPLKSIGIPIGYQHTEGKRPAGQDALVGKAGGLGSRGRYRQRVTALSHRSQAGSQSRHHDRPIGVAVGAIAQLAVGIYTHAPQSAAGLFK